MEIFRCRGEKMPGSNFRPECIIYERPVNIIPNALAGFQEDAPVKPTAKTVRYPPGAGPASDLPCNSGGRLAPSETPTAADLLRKSLSIFRPLIRRPFDVYPGANAITANPDTIAVRIANIWRVPPSPHVFAIVPNKTQCRHLISAQCYTRFDRVLRAVRFGMPGINEEQRVGFFVFRYWTCNYIVNSYTVDENNQLFISWGRIRTCVRMDSKKSPEKRRRGTRSLRCRCVKFWLIKHTCAVSPFSPDPAPLFFSRH